MQTALSYCPVVQCTFVDINFSKEGANAFRKGFSNFDHFSSNLKEIRKLRKNKQLNARNLKKLENHYLAIQYNIARNADREIFREEIPQSEIQDWLNYVIEEFKCVTKKPKLINSGELFIIGRFVLGSCNDMFERHIVPISLAFESEFFQVLASFVKTWIANATTFSDDNIGQCIGNIAFYTLVTASLLKSWSMDKIFKKFEASGFLEQILRCSTVSFPRGTYDTFPFVLQELQSYTGILTRKFKSGEPCGDTLKTILEGRDGVGNIHPETLNRLQGLARLVDTMDPTELIGILASGTCSHCSKKCDDAELSFCARCRFVVYCSPECQKADWQTHKCNCRKLTTAERDRAFSLSAATFRFMNRNFEAVFQEMDMWCVRKGFEACELAVQIRFMPRNSNEGAIPALDEPTSFKVVPIQHLISTDLPAFFGDRPTNLQRSWLKDLAKNMKRECISTSGVLFVFHADRTYIDTHTIEQYRQAGSCVGDVQMKLGTSWCSSRVTGHRHLKKSPKFDSEVIDDSRFQLL